MARKKNHSSYIVISGVIAAFILIAAGFFIFFYHGQHNYPRRFAFSRNFTINQTQVDETASFFQNSPSTNQTNAYCSQNRLYCFAYCRANPTNPDCAGLFNYTRNYSYGSPMMYYNYNGSAGGAQ